MKFWLISVLVFLALSTSVAQQAARTTPSAIEGVVRDLRGRPIPAASVYAVDYTDIRRRRIETTADANGRFVLRDVPAGTFSVHAYKESAGYPDAFFSFFLTNKKAWQQVEVQAGRASRNVVIELGPEYATLNLSIQDERGQPINNAVLTFIRDDDSKRPYSVGSNSSVVMLVPPVSFRLKVEAKGYEKWSDARGAAEVNRPIVLRPRAGENLSVTARLKRLSRNRR